MQKARSHAAHIRNLRLIVAGVVRLCSYIFFAAVLWRAADMIGWFFQTNGSFLQNTDVLKQILLHHGGGGMLLFSVLAPLTFVYADAIARHIVKMTEHHSCPKCHFSLDKFRADRCPECGLYLGEDFHAPPPPSQSESLGE